MNYSNLIAWIAMLGIISVGAPSIGAQVGGHIEGSHTMLSPADLKWVDVPSLPSGAKLAIIEGPLTEAVHLHFACSFPPTIRSPRTGIQRLNGSP